MKKTAPYLENLRWKSGPSGPRKDQEKNFFLAAAGPARSIAERMR